MYDLNWIKNNKEEFDEELAKRGVSPLASQILELDNIIRQRKTKLQELSTQKNLIVKQIGIKKKKGEDIDNLLADSAKIKIAIQELEQKDNKEEDELQQLLTSNPNLLSKDVPFGKNENDNQELRKWGKKKEISFKPKQHFELGEGLGMMDFKTAVTISGSRFVILKDKLAKLERALASFMLDTHIDEFGYTEINPPVLVKDKAMFGVGQLPKFSEDSFTVDEKYRLTPTAEVTLTNMVREKIIDEKNLPLRYVAYTQCFRSEAGAAGRDTTGMIRQHQFSKVELVSIVKKEDSFEELERKTQAAEKILQYLDLPYRVVILCTGDIGFSSVKTYDLEVWLPGQDKYREISSCSNCKDFQARRMKARYRKDNGDIEYVHTLNGSGLAVGRTIVAVLENYQQEDGSIKIPDILVPYMGGIKLIQA